MGMFTKEEKLFIDEKTGKSKWVTTKRGINIPTIRKQPSDLDRKIKAFQKKQKVARKNVRSAKIKHYKKKWSNVQDALERNINPDLYNIGGFNQRSSPKKKTNIRESKTKYIIRDGVAYKVAGMGKPKKKKKKKVPSSTDWLDPFDFDMGGDLF